jgi:hypothetical protein
METLIQYIPVTGSQQVGGIGPNCYNSVGDLKFIVNGDLGSRIRFDKSYLKFEYVALNVEAEPFTAIDFQTVSIPWNPIAALIQNTYYQLNGTNQTVERLDANFQHGNMIKILTTYTAEALEAASDHFFTPCMESQRDLKTNLSAESRARALDNLTDRATVPGPLYGSKIVMLSDIFDSLRAPVACFAQLFQLYMTLKAPDEILFKATANTDVNRFYVTGIKLFIVQNRLSESQLRTEAARISGPEPITRVGYRRFDVISDVHANAKSYITTGIKNLQAAILMFPSTVCADTLGINPFQYCYANGLVNGSGLSYYRHRYGAMTYPLSGQAVETINRARNTEMYEAWRTLSRMISDNGKTFATPVQFFPHVVGVKQDTDTSSYVFFPAVFCNQDTAPMRVTSGYDHEIITNGGDSRLGYIVRVRLNAYAIGTDTMVTIMD